MEKKEVLAVLTHYEENTPYSVEQGADVACVVTTVEEGVEALKELEDKFVNLIKESLGSNNIEFDENNLEVSRQYNDRHFSPNLKVSYYADDENSDDMDSISLTHKAELVLTEMRSGKKDNEDEEKEHICPECGSTHTRYYFDADPDDEGWLCEDCGYQGKEEEFIDE